MAAIRRLYGSTVGKKTVMALTGAFLLFFVFVHMFGNLKIFLGAEALNHYAEGLREFGYPIMPHGWFLWAFRAVLLGIFLLHIATAGSLWHKASTGRPEGYKEQKDLQATLPSKTMLLAGIAILLFVVAHLAHFTFGVTIEGFDRHQVYANVVKGFSNPIAPIVYIVGMVFLGMHILHGAWSMFQTLGLNNRSYTDLWRGFAWLMVILVAGINVTFPLYVLFASPSPEETVSQFWQLSRLLMIMFGF